MLWQSGRQKPDPSDTLGVLLMSLSFGVSMKTWFAVAVLAVSAVAVGCHDDGPHGDPEGHIQRYRSKYGPDSQVPTQGAILASSETPATQPSGKVVTAGGPMTVTSAPVAVSEVLAHPEKYADQPIRIEGTVSSVCEKKGCWARLTDDKTPAGQDLFVKFECPEADDGRVLPLSVKGNPAVVQGTVKVTEMSEAKARHYAKDAEKSDAEVNQIVGPQKQVTVASPSVQVTVK